MAWDMNKAVNNTGIFFSNIQCCNLLQNKYNVIFSERKFGNVSSGMRDIILEPNNFTAGAMDFFLAHMVFAARSVAF